MIYFDACYVAKFYLAEPDSPNVIACVQSQPRIGCLSLGIAEVISVFHRKFREGVVDEKGFHFLCDQFASDRQNGFWQWFPLGDSLLEASSQRMRALGNATFLRAADALYLACAAEEGFATIHTSDRHIIAAAPSFGLQAVTL